METDNWKKFPPCFSCRADYELWLNNRYQWNLAAHHCTDCLPSYKMRMAKAGRCEHPETTFRFLVEEGFEADDVGVHICGTWRDEPQPQIVRLVKQPKPKRVPQPKPEKKSGLEWALERHRQMLERMNFGR